MLPWLIAGARALGLTAMRCCFAGAS